MVAGTSMAVLVDRDLGVAAAGVNADAIDAVGGATGGFDPFEGSDKSSGGV